MKELHEILEEVNDKDSFILFSKTLMEDRKPHEGKNIDEVGFVEDWTNNDIWGFLESAIAWAEDTNFGVTQDSAMANNPWKQFAVFLYCGKIYE